MARALLMLDHQTTAEVGRSTHQEAIMDKFAPELAQFWLADDEEDVALHDRRPEDDRRVEQKALEDLAGLVSAARSIV